MKFTCNFFDEHLWWLFRHVANHNKINTSGIIYLSEFIDLVFLSSLAKITLQIRRPRVFSVRSYQANIGEWKFSLPTLRSCTSVDVWCEPGVRRCFTCSYFKNTYVFGKPCTCLWEYLNIIITYRLNWKAQVDNENSTYLFRTIKV